MAANRPPMQTDKADSATKSSTRIDSTALAALEKKFHQTLYCNKRNRRPSSSVNSLQKRKLNSWTSSSIMMSNSKSTQKTKRTLRPSK